MKRSVLIVLAMTCLLSQAVFVEAQWPPGEKVAVLRRFASDFKLDGRKERIPDRFISDERRWAEVWQILHGEMDRPKVDFKQEIVLVGVIGDSNRMSIEAWLKKNGDLEVGTMATLMHESQPASGSYVLHVISRQGIRSVNGQPLRTGIWRTTTRPELPLD